MGDVVIRVEGLSKVYRLGKKPRRDTLYDLLTDALTAPWCRAWSLMRGQALGRAPLDEMIWALKAVSFEVERGEVVGIIGRNGAGKSTLLKILSRITEMSAGWAEVRGRVGSLLEVGTGFHRELTGRENIYLNGTILGMKKAEIARKFDEIVAFAEVARFIDTPVKHYSSGMHLRLAFAVAAHFEPQVLMVDEVLAVGDVSFQRKCLGKMRDVAQQGRTVLFVSHNLPAITRLCSRALLLDQGRLVDDGAAADVIATYLQSAVEGGGSRNWLPETAPGTADIKLISVALMKDDGSSASVVSVEDRLHLRIGYVVHLPRLTFRCAAHFYTQGVCAFTSLEPEECERTQGQVYYSTVTIPSHLLTEGEYSITIDMFASRGKRVNYVSAKEVILFHVGDPMTGNSARGDYAERLRGVVRPRLQWCMHTEDMSW